MDKNKNMKKSTNTNPTLQLGFWQICPKIGIGAMSTSVGQARQGQNWCSLSTNVSNYKCVFFVTKLLSALRILQQTKRRNIISM